jgi:hypothetical protein
MRHVGQLNSQIADWLQVRFHCSGTGYARSQGCRNGAESKRPMCKASGSLRTSTLPTSRLIWGMSPRIGCRRDGIADPPSVFSTPWQKIVSATEAAAESHHKLAQNIETDVERPLREFAATNREAQAMNTITGNLAAMAHDIETAKKKAEKLREKGAKAKASSVASAVAEVENATIQWESQAPYVFEKLQAVDESRLNHLRDALTQFQTHEVDQVERNRISAEDTLNVLLNIETADEIQTWSLRMRSEEKPQPTRKGSSFASPSRNLAPPPVPATPSAEDNKSQKSQKGGLGMIASLPWLLLSDMDSPGTKA